MRRFYQCLGLVLTLSACSSTSSTRDDGRFVTIDVARYADAPDTGDIDDIFEFVWTVNPEVTDSTLMKYPRLVGESDDYVYVRDYNNMMVFDKVRGHCVSTFDKSGQGPGEYVTTWYGWKTPGKEGWTVLDNRNERVLEYDMWGHHLATVDVPGTGCIIPGKDIWFSVPNVFMTENDGKDIVIHTSSLQWQVTDSIPTGLKPFFLDGGRIHIPMEYYPGLDNDMYCFDRNDTIYSVSSQGIEPVVALNLGDMGLPRSESNKERSINQQSGKYLEVFRAVTNGRHLMVTTGYRRKIRFQIYSLLDGSLIYSIATPENPTIAGFPVTIDGIETFAIMDNLISPDGFYLFVHPDAMIEATGNEDANPAFARVKIKQ